jgi:hypothetical protein
VRSPELSKAVDDFIRTVERYEVDARRSGVHPPGAWWLRAAEDLRRLQAEDGTDMNDVIERCVAAAVEAAFVA